MASENATFMVMAQSAVLDMVLGGQAIEGHIYAMQCVGFEPDFSARFQLVDITRMLEFAMNRAA